ncbi:MAG: DNA repair protein RecO [Lachnospiraceae bacterium]|nr:DNA repair protein RecO [Lachnospiraceae bacterium]
MAEKITVPGIVMQTGPIGEFDKRCVILTTELGRISAFARSARKPGNRLMGTTEGFVFGDFTLSEGRSSYSVLYVDAKNYFNGIRSDIVLTCYGMYFMEFASYYTRENVNESETLKLIYQTLRIMEKGTVPIKLIRRIFELKLMSIHGEAPQVFSCIHCNKKEDLKVFDYRRGGLLCDKCAGDALSMHTVHVSEAALYTMRFIISTPVKSLYTFNVKDEVLEELSDLIDRYMKVYIDRSFHSLEMLKQLDPDVEV